MAFQLMKQQCACSSTLWFSTCIFLLLWTRNEAAEKVQPPENDSMQRFFVFGDSIAHVGNNDYLKTITKCNFPPNGREFMGGIPTGRFSNGKIPPDSIAEAPGIGQSSPPAYLDTSLQIEDFQNGANFASGGSGYDPETPKLKLALSLSDQLKLLKDYQVKLREIVGEERTNSILDNSIYIVPAGNVDIGFTYTLNNPLTMYGIPSYTDFLVSQASSLLKAANYLNIKSLLDLSCQKVADMIKGKLLRRSPRLST